MKLNLGKIKEIKKPDFSKLKRINVRKLNLTTILAIFSYLNVLVIIPLLVSKNKPFVRFHAKQGAVLLALFALGFFSLHVTILPWLVALLYIFLLLSGIVSSVRGSERHLPVIGKLADRL